MDFFTRTLPPVTLSHALTQALIYARLAEHMPRRELQPLETRIARLEARIAEIEGRR